MSKYYDQTCPKCDQQKVRRHESMGAVYVCDNCHTTLLWGVDGFVEWETIKKLGPQPAEKLKLLQGKSSIGRRPVNNKFYILVNTRGNPDGHTYIECADDGYIWFDIKEAIKARNRHRKEYDNEFIEIYEVIDKPLP